MVKSAFRTSNIKLSDSQNFLKNPEFVKILLDKTNINVNDLVIEIGTGKGIITDLLSNKARRVIGVEIDHYLENCFRFRNNQLKIKTSSIIANQTISSF